MSWFLVRNHGVTAFSTVAKLVDIQRYHKCCEDIKSSFMQQKIQWLVFLNICVFHMFSFFNPVRMMKRCSLSMLFSAGKLPPTSSQVTVADAFEVAARFTESPPEGETFTQQTLRAAPKMITMMFSKRKKIKACVDTCGFRWHFRGSAILTLFGQNAMVKIPYDILLISCQNRLARFRSFRCCDRRSSRLVPVFSSCFHHTRKVL